MDLVIGQRSDEDLARDAATGSRGAFEALVRKYSDPVLAFCYHLVRDPAAAEDLTQETFLRAFRNLSRFDPSRRFSSWLIKLAQNVCMDALRRKKVRPSEVDPSEVPAFYRTGDRDDFPDLDGALAALPEKYRSILHHRYRLGLSAPEIAELLELSPEDVRVTLHRAILLLRERLGR